MEGKIYTMDKFSIPAGANLAHAYIAASPNEGARNSAARSLAAAMLCEGGGARPCGACPACRKAELGIHPDIIAIGPGTDDKGRKRREIPVDTVRQIAASAYVLPNEARRKAYIIEDADTMNQQAQNAFLKLLEEPPERAAFILCAANAAALLPTVRSRCETLRINLPAEESEEAAADAKALLERVALGSRGGLFEWCHENEDMDSRRCSAMLRAAREELAGALRSRGAVELTREDCARLDALFARAGEYLRLNVGVKNVMGLIAADGIEMRE